VGISLSKRSNKLFTNQLKSLSTASAAYNQTVEAFPSIVIGSDGNLSAQGPFAESQAQVSFVCWSLLEFVCIHI
jgi:hypothetical protein